MRIFSRFLMITAILLAHLSFDARAQHRHGMQHGFIISADGVYFSHLVATGHHSHQLSFSGKLRIQDPQARAHYGGQSRRNHGKSSYFLFQAQELNLPLTQQGQVLRGHIIESPVGEYRPDNVIVREALVTVEKVHINTRNPFFIEE